MRAAFPSQGVVRLVSCLRRTPSIVPGTRCLHSFYVPSAKASGCRLPVLSTVVQLYWSIAYSEFLLPSTTGTRYTYEYKYSSTSRAYSSTGLYST